MPSSKRLHGPVPIRYGRLPPWCVPPCSAAPTASSISASDQEEVGEHAKWKTMCIIPIPDQLMQDLNGEFLPFPSP